MSIAINSNFERDQLVASYTGQVQFFYSFPIFDETYLTVFKYAAGAVPDDRIQQLTLGVDYQVFGVGEEAGGYINLTVGAIIGDIVTLMGTEPIDRTSVFTDYNPFTVALNQQLNTLTVLAQQTYTYWNNFTPRYNADELISQEVRPQKRILPMLPDGHVWVGRGDITTNPDDIVTALFASGGVQPLHPGMRPSIALWTGTDFVLTDSNLNIAGDYIIPVTITANQTTGFSDLFGAVHMPAHGPGNRPASPNNGDMYYDNSLNNFYGYVNGAWVPFSTGSGSTGSVGTIVNQANTFTVGQLLYIDVAGIYQLANASDPVRAEVVGMVTAIVTLNTTFIVQEVGYITGLPAPISPMVLGGVYFLSTTVNGAMSLVEPNVNGQVSLPVFVAATLTDGWLLDKRGLVIGTGLPINPGTGLITQTITQAGHGLVNGQVVYIDGLGNYSLALANALPSAWGIGFVIQVIDANTFTLQVDGFIGPGVFEVLYPLGFTLGGIYYIDDAIPGNLNIVSPTALTSATKSMFVAYTTNTGWILPHRPFLNSAITPVTVTTPTPANSIAQFTGTGTQLEPTGLVITGTLINPVTPGQTVGFSDDAGGAHIPGNAANPGAPSNGDIYYNTILNIPYMYINGVWQPINFGGGGAGHGIIQSKYFSYTTPFQVGASPSWVNIPLISGPITLSNAANRVKVTIYIGYLSATGNGNFICFGVGRNGTPVGNGSGSVTNGIASTTGTLSYPFMYQYVDTPGSIGPITYSAMVIWNSGVASLNINGQFGGTGSKVGAISSIILEEIAP